MTPSTGVVPGASDSIAFSMVPFSLALFSLIERGDVSHHRLFTAILRSRSREEQVVVTGNESRIMRVGTALHLHNQCHSPATRTGWRACVPFGWREEQCVDVSSAGQ
jgi:hypothetical protein